MTSDKVALPTWTCVTLAIAPWLRKLRRPLMLTNAQYRNLIRDGSILGYRQLRVTISRTHTVIIFLDIITTGTWEKPCDFRGQIATFEASNIAAHAAAVVVAVAASQPSPPLHPSQHEYKVWFGPDTGTVIDFNADVIKLAFNTGAEQAIDQVDTQLLDNIISCYDDTNTADTHAKHFDDAHGTMLLAKLHKDGGTLILDDFTMLRGHRDELVTEGLIDVTEPGILQFITDLTERNDRLKGHGSWNDDEANADLVLEAVRDLGGDARQRVDNMVDVVADADLDAAKKLEIAKRVVRRLQTQAEKDTTKAGKARAGTGTRRSGGDPVKDLRSDEREPPGPCPCCGAGSAGSGKDAHWLNECSERESKPRDKWWKVKNGNGGGHRRQEAAERVRREATKWRRTRLCGVKR